MWEEGGRGGGRVSVCMCVYSIVGVDIVGVDMLSMDSRPAPEV
jgi:hypothetical protein